MEPFGIDPSGSVFFTYYLLLITSYFCVYPPKGQIG